MKLTSFRLKDKVDLLDLLDVGLVDESWCDRFPPELGARLRELVECMERERFHQCRHDLIDNALAVELRGCNVADRLAILRLSPLNGVQEYSERQLVFFRSHTLPSRRQFRSTRRY